MYIYCIMCVCVCVLSVNMGTVLCCVRVSFSECVFVVSVSIKYMEGSREDWGGAQAQELDCLGSNPCPASYQLCDLEHVSQPH